MIFYGVMELIERGKLPEKSKFHILSEKVWEAAKE